MLDRKSIFCILVLDGHRFSEHFERTTTATMAQWQSSSSLSDFQHVRVINRDPQSSRSNRTIQTVKIDDANLFRPATNRLNDSSDSLVSSIHGDDATERTFNGQSSYEVVRQPVHKVIKVVHRDPKLARARQRFQQQVERHATVTLSEQEDRPAHSAQRSDDDDDLEGQNSDSRPASETNQRNSSAKSKSEDKEIDETIDDTDAASVSFLSSHILTIISLAEGKDD